MLENPKVSIITPAHNAEKFLGDAVGSVLRQTYKNWEMFIIDDGSTDDTFACAKNFATGDSRIRAIKNEQNLGVAATRNRGVEMANGEYIAFLDADDVWCEDKLERQLNCLKKTESDLVYTGARCISDSGEFLDKVFKVPTNIDYASLLRGNDIVCSSVLIKTERIRCFPMQRSDLHEDYICWLSILKEGHIACGINEPLVLYRLTENSKSRSKFKSARMTWEVYKLMSIPLLKRSLYFVAYTAHGIRRYM